MAGKVVNQAMMTVVGTPGTGPITLAGAVAGFNTFAQAGVNDGDIVSYSLIDASVASEKGYGTYSAAGPTLTRNTILTSTNGNAPINASASTVAFIDPSSADYLALGSFVHANFGAV